MPPSLPEDLSALQLAVERAAKLHENASYRSNGQYTRFFHLGDFDASYPDMSVKYTDHVTMEPECVALQVLYTLASSDVDAAPHVPRPIHYFHQSDGWHWGYMVMERVAVREVPYEELCVKTAEAVKWMRAQRPPPMKFFGSLGGCYARHNIFQDTIAPLRFQSVAAAERYFNTVISWIRRPWSPVPNVCLADEEVVLTQSDMDASNFGVDTDGRPVIWDAATIQALPVTLADFTLLRTTQFAKDVAAHMFTEDEMAARRREPNMMSLGEVRRRVFMGADPTYGLDEDGNVKPGGRRRKQPVAETPAADSSFATDG
ncbi:hypothetical protein DFH06DRAFT_1089702 [Mycena polygramma]|nr:hypothetical protein DFH06DRAFT_1089702 [Mycena polygramma]